MTKTEAAERLGVSQRTLERLCAKGKLKKGTIPGKTRPVVDFLEEEVERLRHELGREAETLSAFRQAPSGSIGFRLDAFYVRRLTQKADEHGLSPGEYARLALIRDLEGDAAQRPHQDEVRALREALADTFFAFLTLKCGSTAEEAGAFVRDTILREGTRA